MIPIAPRMIYMCPMVVIASDGHGDLPDLTPSNSKILEVILLVLERAEAAGQSATQFDIAKTVFLADLRHLEMYGRPITFDNFYAMEFGPVPSRTYDRLKPGFRWISMGLERAPWRVENIDSKTKRFSRPARSANRRKLSGSEISLIEQAFADVKAMGFKETSDFTHKLRAYKEAWATRGSLLAKKMDLRVLLPDFDRDMIADLEFASKYSS